MLFWELFFFLLGLLINWPLMDWVGFLLHYQQHHLLQLDSTGTIPLIVGGIKSSRVQILHHIKDKAGL